MSANELLEPPATETLRARDERKRLPAEVWALLILDSSRVVGQNTPHNLVMALDSWGDPFLAFTNYENALDSAVFHLNQYGIECEPVRLK